jgi:uncharacterized membrane protein YgcG
VVVNKGKLTHGLAIMGTGLSPKRTATLAAGKTARLTVTLKAGSYHIWDPVRSSMSHARMLTVNASQTSSGGSGGSGMVSGSGSGGSSSGGSSTGSTGGSTTVSGMDGCDHM